jgi:N-methylhydantoinase A/oxoprolinase/acetone carboxylase beta subunit
MDEAGFVKEFQATYERLYRHLPGDLEIELLTWRTRVAAPSRQPPTAGEQPKERDPPGARKAMRAAYFPDAGGFVDTPTYERAQLTPGMGLDGPALIEERESTTVVLPGMTARVDEHANLRLAFGGR